MYFTGKNSLPPPPRPWGGGEGGKELVRLPQNHQESANTSPNKKGGGRAKRAELGSRSLYGVQAYRLGPWMGLIVFLGRHACTGTHARTTYCMYDVSQGAGRKGTVLCSLPLLGLKAILNGTYCTKFCKVETHESKENASLYRVIISWLCVCTS